MERIAGSNLDYMESPAKMQLFKKNKNCIRKFSAHLKYLVLTFFILLIQEAGFSQNDSAQEMSVYDSTKLSFDSAANNLFDNIKRFRDSAQRKNLLEYKEDTIATKQDEIIKSIKTLTLEAQHYLEKGLDTTGLTSEVNQIEHWYDITSEGVFTNTGTMQTQLNLETSYKIMRELLIRITARKSSIDEYYKNLVDFRNTIDSFYKDNILYLISSDSSVLMRYVERLTVVSQEVKPIDSALKKTLISVGELQPPINMLTIKLGSSLEQIGIFQKSLSYTRFRQEMKKLWEPVGFVRPLDEIINFSKRKAALSFVFYVRNEIGEIILLLILVVAGSALLLNLKRKMQKQNLLNKNNLEQLVLKYPFLSALFIILNIFQFIFIDPPFVFALLIWILCGVSLSFILKNVFTRYWMISWLTLFILFLFACFDSLILQVSRPERWMMVALSIAGILCGSAIMLSGPRGEVKGKLFIYFIGFVVVMQIMSIVSNVYGRYNISKTCLTAGFFGVVLATLFFWTLRFIGQALVLGKRMYGKPDPKLLNTDFQDSGSRSGLFYVLLFVGWFVLFSRNFYAFKFISEPVKDFIIQKRTIGDSEFSFTIGDLLECFLVLYISALVSRLVSFLASGETGEQGSAGRKGGIGNWSLIIRITIISVGLLLAFAAAGIPMDKLTIILSALSVGVGFGLQKLVNNLVSGLIISFEKPVTIGDIVEVGGLTGTIKSIGFRSCIMTTPDGANMVIPNGELLDKHLINWTHDNTSRSVDVTVSVAHGTDLEQAIKILKGLLGEEGRILPDPAPSVIITQFSSSAIDMELSFWVKNMADLSDIKSDVILAIDLAFKEHSIKIPGSPSKEKIQNKDEDE